MISGYLVNVFRDGKLYFSLENGQAAMVNRSAMTRPYREAWAEFLLDLAGRFPVADGFEIQVTTFDRLGRRESLADHIINLHR